MPRPKTTDNKDTYLHQPKGPGTTYYARVTVPRTLVKLIGQTHIRRTLKTASKGEANLRKHAVVGQIKAELDALRKTGDAREAKPGYSFAEAKAFRLELEKLRAEDVEQAADVELVAVTQAESIERLYGTAVAQRWFRTATSDAETLSELMDRWLGGRDFKESTKMGHRKALNEVLDFVKNKDAYPSDITHEQVLRYIDDDLMQRGLAAHTIRDRLVSLGGFWEWMGTRKAVPRGSNPWKGHHVSKKQHLGSRPPKRQGGFLDDELVRLLDGNERVSSWDTYAYLPDLIVLGMFTGARLETLAAMTGDRVEKHPEGYVLRIENDKTAAGTRPVGITHPAPLSVIKRRQAAAGKGLLFGELRQGGADDKWSAAASKAFGRYRRACEVPDGTDFHSFRRCVTRVLEQAGLMQSEIARFVGHKVGTLAADTYAGPRQAAWALEVSKKVRYGAAVEERALVASERALR